MAQVKEAVACDINRGNSVKSIVSGAVENEDLTKWDVIKVLLWWAWFKTIQALQWLLKWTLIVLGVVLWIVCCSIIGAVGAFIVALVVLLTSPIWMPFRLWKAPEKVAKLLLNTDYKDINEPEDVPLVVGGNVWLFGIKAINWAWKPIYSLLPMNRRKFFIDEANKKIESYPTEVQVAYYDEQKSDNKESTMRHMSEEAMRLVWNRGVAADRANILNSWDLLLEKYQLLFENEDKLMYKLLKLYCTNEEKQVDGKLQSYFVKQLAGERADRAYEILLVCADVNKRTLEVQTLKDLISMLGGDHGEQAYDILTTYWERCTLPSEVVEALVKTATESVVDDGKRRAYELLKKAVKRDGLSTDLAELFFSRCDSVENDEMTEVINERIDCLLIDSECVSATNEESVRKLTDYFTIREDVSVEGQKLLREWQYELYRKTGHKLDAEAISYLLVKRLKESDISFFLQVLDEAWENLSEADAKLMILTPWKRDILVERLAKDERRKGVGQV